MTMTLRCSRLVVAAALFVGPCVSFTVFPSRTYRFALLSQPEPTEECSLEAESAADCLESSGFIEQNNDESFMSITKVFTAQVESLRDSFPSYEDPSTASGTNLIKYHTRQKRSGHHLHCRDPVCQDDNSHVANMEYSELVDDDAVVLVDTIRKPGMESISRAFPSAGPRKYLHFNPSKVNAAIVTCGGLCPGLNNVIRELVHALFYLYGVNEVLGIKGGYNGFKKQTNPDFDPVKLTPELVENIHHEGGTILRTSRGGFDIEKIVEFLESHKISQLYVIGGDGTHRGAYAIHQACITRKLNVAVVGVPKTIDNDCDYIDRSFGFQSAVEAAQTAIHTAKTEAMCKVPNGIGVVKLMGRSAGFLAAFAALGSGDVDLVLVPEVPIVLEGEDGILPFLRQRVQEQKYAVVVLAEGAGEELLGKSEEIIDAGGNRALPEIAPFIVNAIKEHYKENNDSATVTYIDPSYTVRSVPANGADSLYCTQLAQNAVHGASKYCNNCIVRSDASFVPTCSGFSAGQ
jgi:6-phosphofructokinase 1